MSESKTYTEMMEYAKTIHPDARVRFNFDQNWEIFIPTDFDDSYEVDESWAGTPAETAYNTMSSGGESELHRWARKNSHSMYPNQILAESYNLLQAKTEYIYTQTDEKLVNAGFMTLNDIVGKGQREITSEETKAYHLFYDEAKQEADKKFAVAFGKLGELMEDFS